MDISLLIYFSISCLFFIINYTLGQTNCWQQQIVYISIIILGILFNITSCCELFSQYVGSYNIVYST